MKWVNSHLIRVNGRIGDLYIDLRDGKQLIKLLEILSGERLVGGGILYDFFLMHLKSKLLKKSCCRKKSRKIFV